MAGQWEFFPRNLPGFEGHIQEVKRRLWLSRKFNMQTTQCGRESGYRAKCWKQNILIGERSSPIYRCWTSRLTGRDCQITGSNAVLNRSSFHSVYRIG